MDNHLNMLSAIFNNDPRRVADLQFEAEMKRIAETPICVEGQYEFVFEIGRDGERD